MAPNKITVDVRKPNPRVAVLDIKGDVTNQAEAALLDAYNKACDGGTKNVALNFTGLEYMNSSGIGLLVTMLIRAQRNGQKLLAYGLTDHYHQIFELTQLDKAIRICADEANALASAE
ncbi:MAG: STAS domain-containing protein [Anaerolineae bacterium]|jgi:anti-anti-sigma factor|nr:STAS domain-containing protein [Anaerolineae bacterium]